MAVIKVERLRELLSYDPQTGLFVWRVDHRKHALAGTIAGNVHQHGYRVISVDGRQYHAGRLAFLYMTGRWPIETLDHKNRVRDDDRWTNLREATFSLNQANRRSRNPTGLKGAYKHQGKWLSLIGRPGGGTKYLGIFNTAEEAAAAYRRAARDRYGEFAHAPLTPLETLCELGLVDGSEVGR